MPTETASCTTREWIALRSDLVADTLAEVRLHLAQAMKRRCNVILDMSGVGDMDAAGAALICHLHRELESDGRRLVLVGVHGRARGLMAELALDITIPVNPPTIPR